MNLFIADAFPARYVGALRELGFRVEHAPGTAGEALAARIDGVQVLVVRSTKVDRAVIERGSKLSLILRAGAGYDTIDVAAASERGIFVSNCPGKNSVAVAELTMGLMVALDRRIPAGTRDLREGKWNKKEYSKADGLKGKTVGVCGFGPIGRAVATRAQAFEMDVIVWSRSLTDAQAEEAGVQRCATLDELAGKSDIVTVHLAQTPQTKKLFGASFFAKMREGAMFINTSRAG
jgi:D-3-phosphoglycerate dehydrogenase / 2-oxoglutarate reductase